MTPNFLKDAEELIFADSHLEDAIKEVCSELLSAEIDALKFQSKPIVFRQRKLK